MGQITKEKRVPYLWKKRDILLEKIHHYNNLQSEVFRLKNYWPHIKRNTTRLQEVNDEIYRLTGIDRNKIAL